MKIFIMILMVALFLLHQDNWYWEDDSLVFGFMPIGLFYHACLSIAGAGVGLLATRFAWPDDAEEASEENGERGT